MDDSSYPSSHVVLITGPSRSGKSEWAELLAAQSGKAVTYVATACIDPADVEWQTRIIRHQQRRPPTWKTLSGSTNLTSIIQRATADQCMLIDSLGTWLANRLDQTDDEWAHDLAAFIHALSHAEGLMILVAEETGWGVVPAYPSGRKFRDRLGDLTRQIGAIATSVYLVTGGYALNVSELGTRLPPINLGKHHPSQS
ncbi:MAG: bifunctional adenosylcobinamide kinase/adenosylcobinamide-phosphate guanylyltransferase [Elainellaceae cyanobacterium]